MRTICLFIGMFWMSNSFAQNHSKLMKEAQKEAAEINYWLELNESISPFFTAEEVKYVFEDYASVSPNADPWEIIDICNSNIAYLLEKFITNEKYAAIRPDTMVHTTKTYSPDEKIIVHNWYANNGGTFLMHYNYLQSYSETGKIEFNELDLMGAVYEIGNLAACGNHCYYLIGETRGCSNCTEYSVQLFRADMDGTFSYEGFVTEELLHTNSFAFSFENWDFDNNYISFNEIDHSFEYAITYSDISTDVFYEEGRWIFDGTYFVKEITMQLSKEEFRNLNGGADNN